jgi:hypothetical protein
MIARLFASAVLVAGLSQAALAQTNTQQNQGRMNQGQLNQDRQNQGSMSAENTQGPRVPQMLRQRLTSAGFSDVNIVPRSLVITARDRDGRPVLMRITPNSMFFLTEIAAVSSPTTGAAAQGSNESAQQDQASTSAENTQSPAGNAPQSATTGVARGGSNETAQQDQASASAENTQSQNVPQTLRERLTSAGLSDVRIVPSSLIITARDMSDRPVMMHITPRSISILTEVPAASSSASDTDNSDGSGQRR